MTDSETGAPDAASLTQRVAAPPEVVFEFFVDPEKMIRWMGTAADLEPEVGGGFRVDVNGRDVAVGNYLEVDPPRRVVFTWGWEGSEEVPPGSSTVTVTLTPDGDHTTIELGHGGLPGGANDEHVKGWTYHLARLEVVFEGGDPKRSDKTPPG